MDANTLKGIFILISDGWSGFKTPQSELILSIWHKALSPYDEQTIRRAIEELYTTEPFFSFSKLTEKIEEISLGPVMSKLDTIKAIHSLLGSYDTKISEQPEIVRLTLDYAGGSRQVQMMDAQWQAKRLSDAYDQAIKEMRKSSVKGLSAPERLAIE